MTPLLSSIPPAYNNGIAETYSWVQISDAGRPFFAKATYLTNASDISISLSATNINLNLEDVENQLYIITDILNSSQLPYNADQQLISYYTGTNNVYTIVYKKNGTTLKTRTFTYLNGGSADNDLLTGVSDS